MVTVPGAADSAKFAGGGAFTVREIVVVLEIVPELPVIVIPAVPGAALLPTVSVKVLLLEAEAGLKDAVTPLGKPVADKLTFPVNPFSSKMVTVVVTLLPCTTVKLPGDADSAKLGSDDVPGQLFTRLAAFIVPMPVAKSHPGFVPYAGLKEVFEVDRTPAAAPSKKQL